MKKGNWIHTIFNIIFSVILGAIGMYLFLGKQDKTISQIESIAVSKTTEEISDFKDAINNIYDATVYIETQSFKMRSSSSGSGFVYKKDDNYGYIITNYHVVEGSDDISITFMDGSECSAEVIGMDEYSDIAILRVDVKYVLQVAKIGSSSNVTVGDTVFTVGAPMGKDFIGTITKGILSGKNRMVSVRIATGEYLIETLQTDASINSGNSGGPLCNIAGEVIGVNSSKLKGTGIEGMGFAIPIDNVITILEDLEQGRKISRPYLGVQMADVYADNFEYGVMLVAVEQDMPASDAGLKRGDVIVEIDGEQVKSSSYLRLYLYKHNINDKVKIKYYRDNEIKEAEITLSKTVD